MDRLRENLLEGVSIERSRPSSRRYLTAVRHSFGREGEGSDGVLDVDRNGLALLRSVDSVLFDQKDGQRAGDVRTPAVHAGQIEEILRRQSGRTRNRVRGEIDEDGCADHSALCCCVGVGVDDDPLEIGCGCARYLEVNHSGLEWISGLQPIENVFLKITSFLKTVL